MCVKSPFGYSLAQLLERFLGRLELVLLEERAGGEVLVHVAEPLRSFLGHLLEGRRSPSCRRWRSGRVGRRACRTPERGHAPRRTCWRRRGRSPSARRASSGCARSAPRRAARTRCPAAPRSCARTTPARAAGRWPACTRALRAGRAPPRRDSRHSGAAGRRAPPARRAAVAAAQAAAGQVPLRRAGVGAGRILRDDECKAIAPPRRSGRRQSPCAPRRSADRPRRVAPARAARLRLFADFDRRGQELARLVDGNPVDESPDADAHHREDEGAGAGDPRCAPRRYGLNCHGLLCGLAGSNPRVISERSSQLSRSRSMPARTPAPDGTPM